jgi:hypothetical protein
MVTIASRNQKSDSEHWVTMTLSSRKAHHEYHKRLGQKCANIGRVVAISQMMLSPPFYTKWKIVRVLVFTRLIHPRSHKLSRRYTIITKMLFSIVHVVLMLLLLLVGRGSGMDYDAPKEPEELELRGSRFRGRGRGGGGTVMGMGRRAQRRWMMGRGGGGGGGEHTELIHNLVDNREAIERRVTRESSGATTVTTSTDPQVSDWIQEHVEQMLALIENNGRIRQWDPLYVALFDNQDDITTSATRVDGGIRVRLQGSTGCAIDLVQAHADVVSAFLSEGYDEVQASHDAPC